MKVKKEAVIRSFPPDNILIFDIDTMNTAYQIYTTTLIAFENLKNDLRKQKVVFAIQ